MVLDKIPGYRAALAKAAAREEAARDLAFIDCPLAVCGEPIAQLTLAHLVVLFAVRSPFFYGGVIGPEHVAQFLWILSPGYLPADRAARRAFNQRIGRVIPFQKSRAEIDVYLDQVFLDRPGGGGVHGIAITSFVANFIDELAHEYGWTRQQIMAEPLAAIYQYLRRIERRHDPQAVFFNKFTDEVKRAFHARAKKLQAKADRKRGKQ
jgi:hypothetical protein